MGNHLSKKNSRLPAYLRIAQLLRDRITHGIYRPEEFLPPERDLAEELGASRQTIRLAIDTLRQQGLVVPEQGRGTRILRLHPSPLAQEPSDRFHLAALVIYGMSREGSAAIFQGCQAAMRQEDFHLIVCETARDTRARAADEAAHLRALLDKGIQGIIIYAEPTDQNRALLQTALERGVQVVQIDRYLPGLECDYVGVDNVTAAREMVEHLWQAGHRRIAFLSIEPEPSSCQERLQGYKAGLRAHGIEAEPNWIAHWDGQQSGPNDLAHILARWMALPERTTAVFAVNDSLALMIMQALRKQGVHIPEDMAVVGFDNQHLAAFVSPPLTTVQQPFVELGETAARLLLDRMAGRYSGVARRVLLSTRLILRQSCGAGQSAEFVARVPA